MRYNHFKIHHYFYVPERKKGGTERRREEGRKRKKEKGQKLTMRHITMFQSVIYHIHDSATPYNLGEQKAIYVG